MMRRINYGLLAGLGSLVVLLSSAPAPEATPTLLVEVAWDDAFSLHQQQMYRHGEPFTGIVTLAHPNGARAEHAAYSEGKRHGLTTRWYANGQREAERYYTHGDKTGIHWGWWANGTPQYRYEYANGLHHGRAQEWLADGTPFRDFNYAEGHESGRQQMWYPDGTLRANYVVQNGRRYGLIGAKPCT